LVSIKDIMPLHDCLLEVMTNEAIIREKLEEIIKTQTAKDGLLRGIQSEILNDITPVKAYVEILLADHLGPLLSHQRQRLEVARFCIQQLLQHLFTLSDIANIGFIGIKTDYTDAADQKSPNCKIESI